MNQNKTSLLGRSARSAWTALTLIGLCAGALALTAPPARALEIVSGAGDTPSALAVTSNTTATATSGAALDIPPNTDLLLLPSIVSAGAGTSNSTFYFNGTPDKTNWTTTYPITATAVAATGTTRATGATFVSRTNLYGLKQIRFDKVATANPANVTNSWRYSFVR